jgi:hypothetical protein
MNTNTTAQFLLLALIFIYIGGFFLVTDWLSYLIGSFIMFVMSSVVLNKLKAEVKELI